MLKKRLVACLLVREGLLVQSIGFKRYLPVGRPRFPIEFIARWDVDEIVLLDMSATTKNRTLDTSLLELLSPCLAAPARCGRRPEERRDTCREGQRGTERVPCPCAPLPLCPLCPSICPARSPPPPPSAPPLSLWPAGVNRPLPPLPSPPSVSPSPRPPGSCTGESIARELMRGGEGAHNASSAVTAPQLPVWCRLRGKGPGCIVSLSVEGAVL